MIRMQSQEPTRHGKYEIHDVPSRKIEWYRSRGWVEVSPDPDKATFDMTGPWFGKAREVREELGLDKNPKSKAKARELLEEAGYEVV